MPAALPKSAKDVWSVTVEDMLARGLWHAGAAPVVETYVGAVWMARKAREAIDQHGLLIAAADGQLKPNPAASALAKANEAIARLGDDLGLSTVSRNRPGVKGAETIPDDDDAAALGL